MLPCFELTLARFLQLGEISVFRDIHRILGNPNRNLLVRDFFTGQVIAPSDDRMDAQLHVSTGAVSSAARAAGTVIGPSMKMPAASECHRYQTRVNSQPGR